MNMINTIVAHMYVIVTEFFYRAILVYLFVILIPLIFSPGVVEVELYEDATTIRTVSQRPNLMLHQTMSTIDRIKKNANQSMLCSTTSSMLM